MPQNVYSFQAAQTRLVREAAYGVTPVSPTFVRLNGFGVTASPTIETDMFAPPGALVPTIPLINDDFTEGSMEGRVDYNGLAFVLAGLFGNPTINDLGGGAYEWLWSWDGRRPLRPVSYTLHYGFPESADVVTGWIFNTLEISGGRADGFDVSGDGFGKALSAGQTLGGITNEVQQIAITGTPTGGDFTITWNGETTDDIPYNANAAAVLAALEALDSIEPGDVTVGGGALPGTPITVTFKGVYSGENVAAMTTTDSLTGGTAPASAVTTTTPGADNAVDIPAVPAGAVQGNVYLDTSWAGLGGTQLLHAYEMGINIGERLERVRPINKSKSSDGVIDMSEQEHMITLMLGRNSVADAQLAKLRAGTRSFVRCEWEGDIISGSDAYLFQTDACIIYQEAGEPDDVDSVHAREYSGRIAIDPTSKKAIACKLVNSLPSLSGA